MTAWPKRLIFVPRPEQGRGSDVHAHPSDCYTTWLNNALWKTKVKNDWIAVFSHLLNNYINNDENNLNNSKKNNKQRYEL